MNAIVPANHFIVAHDSPESFFAPVSTDLILQLVKKHSDLKERIEQVSQIVTGPDYAETVAYFVQGNTKGDSYRSYLPSVSTLFDAKGAIAQLNSDFWSQALALTDVFDYMPQARRSEWREQIEKNKTPDFEYQTVAATIMDLLNSRVLFLSEKVDGIFRALSKSHVTNTPQAFNSRMILNRAICEYGTVDWERAGFIDDLRQVIGKFLGREESGHRDSREILKRLYERTGEWYEIDGGALRIRVYKKGTAHIEVHPDLAWKLNKVLALLHPQAIPSQLREKPARKSKTFSTINKTLPWVVLNALASLRPWHRGEANEYTFHGSTLDKDTKRRTNEVLELIGGTPTRVGYRFDYDVKPVLDEIIISGLVPDRQTYQYYPTPDHLAAEAIDKAAIRDGHSCLEPSAGQGGLADHMPSDTTCIELSPLQCRILESKGHNVIEADFLKWAESTDQRFDRAVCNPPYSSGRAIRHLEATAGLIKAGGRIVAILPATFKDKPVLEGWECEWSGVYSDEFADTSVSVVMLTADKPAPQAQGSFF